MDGLAFSFHGQDFVARASGALFWPAQDALIVADLHFGKSERMARRGGALLPPFETEATLARLDAELDATRAARLICLGDSFDDDCAARGQQTAIAALCARVAVTWISGNHDPAVADLPGKQASEVLIDGLALRHIAGQGPDISGHFHPKLRIAGQRHPAFLIGDAHLILPAFGAYTGGLDWQADALRALVPEGRAILTGARAVMVPLPPVPRAQARRKRGRSRPLDPDGSHPLRIFEQD